MLDPILKSAFVAVVAALLTVGLKALGVEVSTEVVTAIAVGIVAWLLGVPAGEKTSASIRGSKG